MKTMISRHWLSILAIIAALGAFAPFPYVYYQILDWIVAGAALKVAFRVHRQKKKLLLWMFVAVAVVFNPVAPLYLKQTVWRILDIVVALIFAASLLSRRRKEAV